MQWRTYVYTHTCRHACTPARIYAHTHTRASAHAGININVDKKVWILINISKFLIKASKWNSEKMFLINTLITNWFDYINVFFEILKQKRLNQKKNLYKSYITYILGWLEFKLQLKREKIISFWKMTVLRIFLYLFNKMKYFHCRKLEYNKGLSS